MCVSSGDNNDGKEEDGQSVVSVGEEYEPISDDELDEILADSQKKEDQPEEEKISGTWSPGHAPKLSAPLIYFMYLLSNPKSATSTRT